MTIRHLALPYCLKKLADGRYILLNRYYKPLGFPNVGHVIYEDHPSAMKLKGITKALAKKLSHRDDDNVDNIFFYADGCIPTSSPEAWAAYSKRLEAISKLRVNED